jgi:Family of unknown function (DUF6056)
VTKRSSFLYLYDMFTSAPTKEPSTGRVTYRSYDLLRDAVRLTRMAPGTVLVLGPGAGVAVQAIAVAIAWPEWLRVEREVAVLVDILSRQAHPSVRDVLPSAHALVRALGIGLGSSVLAWVAGAAGMAAPMRRAADRAAAGLTTTLRASLRRTPPAHARPRPAGGIARLCLVSAGCSLVAAVLVAALLATRAHVLTVQVRGSVLTVVEPTVWLMGSALAAVSVVVVTMIPLGRAVLVTAPALAVVGERPRAAAGSGPGAWQERRWFRYAIRPGAERSATASQKRLTTFIAVMLGLGTGALSAAFLAESMLARPIADDYQYFAAIRRLDALAFLRHFLHTGSGRYSQGLLVWIAYRLGGVASVHWMPAVLLGALAATTTAAARAFVPKFGALPRSTALAVGSAASVLAVTAAPTVVDSYLWLTSSTVYVPAIVVLMSACLALRAAMRGRRGGPRAFFAALATLLVVIGQGFYEATSLLAVAAAVIFTAVLAVRRGRAALPLGVLVAAAAITGFAVMYFAPAERIRAQATGGGNVLVASLGAVYGQLQLWQSTRVGAWLLAGAIGLALAVLLARRTSPSALLMVLAAGGVLLVAVPALCAFVSFYSLNWAPWRTYTLASASFCWGTVLLAGSAGALLIRVRKPGAEHPGIPSGMAVIAAACTVIGVVTAVPGEAAIVSAESMRASMMEYRDALVQKQLAAGDRKIVVLPAPLLVYPTDARDFEFTAAQGKGWFEPGYRSYFGIPAHAALRFVTRPPAGYCTDDPRVAAGAAVTCRRGS